MADYVTHCPACGQIFVMDESFNNRCPFCGHRFEDGNED